MEATFFATLNPMLMLFTCIVIGFLLSKTKILPETASPILAKLLLWVFYPALSFSTMARYFTVENIGTHALNLAIATVVIFLVIALATLLSKLFVRQKVYERNIYKYSLAIANAGSVGDPVVDALLGGEFLAFFKMYTLPATIATYTWGLNILTPEEKKQKKNPLLSVLNAPTVALLLGIIVGITGAGGFLLGDTEAPTFFGATLSSLKTCVGPVAMLLAGATVAKYPVKPMLTNVKVYIATLMRMVILPAATVAFVFGLSVLLKASVGLTVDNLTFHLVYFCSGCPLGLNTVVFPEAYGGDPSTGASMAMVSHTLCVAIMPLMYALLCLVFPL